MRARAAHEDVNAWPRVYLASSANEGTSMKERQLNLQKETLAT
eukprot:COSAG06_NODE_27372_length_594_cov_1.367677_2_plen_42_part_01